MKIRYKLPATFLIFSISLTALFYLAGLHGQQTAFRQMAREHLKEVKDSFDDLEEGETKMLLGALEVLSRDPEIKAAYLEKDRDKLYACALPAFNGLKGKTGITRFYFILPDGRVFLRMHDKKIYGDMARQSSFLRARQTGKPAWGIELGKTSFALRAFMPYFKSGKVIGYLELAEGINHFLKFLKDRTRDEFSIIADKRYMDRRQWESVVRAKGGRDNWNDMKNHVVLGSTGAGRGKEKLGQVCFTEENISRVEAGRGVLAEERHGAATFMCGGFLLKNAAGQPIGAILALTDITGYVALARRADSTLLEIAAVFFLITFSAGVVISRLITGPLQKVAGAARSIGKGNLDIRTEVSSPDELGELAGAFNEMVLKRKQAEEHIRMHEEDLERLAEARAKELRATEERYRTIVETAREGVVAVDAKERITFANESMARMLDLKKEDLTGRLITDFMDERAVAEFRARQERRKKGAAEKNFDFRFRSRGGREVWAIVSTSPRIGPGGVYEGFVSMVTDITERRRLETIAEAANLMENIGYIFSGIRHEIANPVVTASITLDVLKRKLKNLSHEQIEEYINRTREQMSRLDFLLKSLRNFNLFESVTLKQVEVPEMVGRFLALVTDDAKKRGIKVESEISPGVQKAYVDERAFAQVLLNIVTNAFDALAGRENPKIRISAHKVNSLILFRVEDNGKGMTPQQLKNLFRPFFTTKPHGTGLGLAIVKKMVSKMQGHVEITSHENEGTAVDIFIPEAAPEDGGGSSPYA